MEIESKFKVADHAPVRERLHQLGAIPQGQVLEVNHILDDPNRSLLASQRGLRVRACHDREGRLISGTLTYKGPPLPGRAKQREEIETTIADPAAAVELFGSLGYKEVIVFHKRRETWRLEGAHVELDELPALGSFVEIEAQDAAQVRHVQGLIGLSSESLTPDTYVALVAHHCRSTGMDPVRLWFPSANLNQFD